MAAAAEGPRARYREQTRAEIKAVALRQLAEGGVSAVALTRIAKELGLSGPALYRYFAGRDDLLGALISDGYDDFAVEIGVAAGAVAGRTPRERLLALADGYRAWALGQPHRYLLLLGSPLPGYVAPPETLLKARAALGPFLAVFGGARPSDAVRPAVEQFEAWARQDAQVGAWVADLLPAGRSEGAAGVALAGAVLAWTRLHGVVGLEVEGHFTGMGHDPQVLLQVEIATLADTFGLDRHR